MIPTREYAERKFGEFNALIFNGQLPPIPIRTTRAKTFLGKCVYSRRRKLPGRAEYYNFSLRISTSYDLPEAEIEDTVIHEMIHYYILYNGITDTSAHGKVFRQIMADINARYGRHVSISHRGAAAPPAAAAESRKWHVVAVVEFLDGRTGFKVLPRVRQSIGAYTAGVARAAEVSSVRLVWTDEPYFNSFPVSKALRVHVVGKDKLAELLAGAEGLTLG